METFLESINAALAGMSPEMRELRIAQLVQIYQAVRVVGTALNVDGRGRLMAWITEQRIARVSATEMAEKMRRKATERKFAWVLEVFKRAAAA